MSSLGLIQHVHALVRNGYSGDARATIKSSFHHFLITLVISKCILSIVDRDLLTRFRILVDMCRRGRTSTPPNIFG